MNMYDEYVWWITYGSFDEYVYVYMMNMTDQLHRMLNQTVPMDEFHYRWNAFPLFQGMAELEVYPLELWTNL